MSILKKLVDFVCRKDLKQLIQAERRKRDTAIHKRELVIEDRREASKTLLALVKPASAPKLQSLR